MANRTPPTSLGQLGEFGLIQLLKRRIGQGGPSIRRGIGDDAAVVQPFPGRLLLLTTDLLAEGIHFDSSIIDMDDLGYKAATSNLSDIAAMGGNPHYLLVALALPATRTVQNVESLYRGVIQACKRHGVHVVGGDTSASRHGLFICLTMIGTSKPPGPLTRDGAKIGDHLYVTGTLGDSTAGLEILQSKHRAHLKAGNGPAKRHVEFLIRRHRRPDARIREGSLLVTHRLATSAMDLSDGLSGDLRHLCAQSKVGAEVEADSLPISPACRWYAAALSRDAFTLAVAGGEDYELLFTVSPENRPRLDRLAQRTRCRFTRVGCIKPKAFGVNLKLPDGPLRPLIPQSYRHFGPRSGRAFNTSTSP